MNHMDTNLVCVDVITLSRLLSDLMSRRLAPFGVGLGQLPTLLALYGRDGQTQAELARDTGVEQPTMALNLGRMERDGLITRSPDPQDGRRALVTLTERALEIRDELQSQRAALDEIAMSGLPASDRDALARVLAAMMANLSAA